MPELKPCDDFDFKTAYEFYPRLTVVLALAGRRGPNMITVAWHTPISFTPPLYGVVISPARASFDWILASRAFSVNFLDFALAEAAERIGSVSGREVDKVEDTGRALFDGSLAPVMEDAYAAFECAYFDHVRLGDHSLIVGKVRRTYLREGVKRAKTLDLERVRPLLYLGDGRYTTADAATARRVRR